MDPITAVGAVASIVQLANAALSLSKTLYTLGEAIASASDDIQALADDLRTFSQSLTLLSRLLEDSKSWYSDDVYLLTAKIIKDCAELYVKIDKVLIKLGGNGKSNWKLRVKFVYKEGQIRKLMKRLRDMKGTLATVLMSLQVDLQLSLLNISSSSKIQRAPDKPLQPETVENLRKAQEVVESCGLLPKYSAYPSKADTEKLLPASPMEGQTLEKIATFQQPHKFPSDIQSFVAIPTMSDESTNAKVKCRTVTGPVFSSLARSHETSNRELEVESDKTVEPNTAAAKTKSVKSSSSVESFKSAVSEQSIVPKYDFSHEIKEVKELLHAFRSALDILGNLIERRIHDRKADVFIAAKNLGASLADGETQLDLEHKKYCRKHGIDYVQSWTDFHLRELQATTLLLMREIVMPLHKYTAERGDLQEPEFLILYRHSENCRIQAIKQINGVAGIAERCTAEKSLMNPRPIVDRTQLRTIQPSQAPEMSLPFISYCFKRFDHSYQCELHKLANANLEDSTGILSSSPGPSAASLPSIPTMPGRRGIRGSGDPGTNETSVVKDPANSWKLTSNSTANPHPSLATTTLHENDKANRMGREAPQGRPIVPDPIDDLQLSLSQDPAAPFPIGKDVLSPMNQMLEPAKRMSVKSRSIFSPIDESRSILSQHWAPSTSKTEQAQGNYTKNHPQEAAATSPQLEPMKVNFKPSSTPPFEIRSPPNALEAGPPDRETSRKPRVRPSQGDAVLIDFMGGGNYSEIARKAGNEPLAVTPSSASSETEIGDQDSQYQEDGNPSQSAGSYGPAPPTIGQGPNNLFGGIMAGGGSKPGLAPTEPDQFRPLRHQLSQSIPGVPTESKKRRAKAAPPIRCHGCNTTETPEWRRGPDGAQTLCNTCGLCYAKSKLPSAVEQLQSSNVSTGGLINLVSSKKLKRTCAEDGDYKLANNPPRFPVAVAESTVHSQPLRDSQEQLLSYGYSSNKLVMGQARDITIVKEHVENNSRQDFEQTEERRRKELADYQLSLLTNLNCRVRAGKPLPPEDQPKNVAHFSMGNTGLDVLQDFDFDSFLYQDPNVQLDFGFDSMSHDDPEQSQITPSLHAVKKDASDSPEQKSGPSSQIAAPVTTQADLDDEDGEVEVYEDMDEENSERDEITQLPIEGTSSTELNRANTWIPQATPGGGLFYFNIETGESSKELPLESLSATENGAGICGGVSVPELTGPPPEMMARGYKQKDDDDNKPLYVNPKQFHRILRRRVARQRLEEALKAMPKKRKPYLHESKHGQCRRRPRHPSGRFMTAEEVEELKNSPQVEEGESSAAETHGKSEEPSPPKPSSTRLMMIPEDPLAPTPRTQLWWMAYTSLHQSHFPTFATVNHELERRLGALDPTSGGVASLCKKISAVVQNIGTATHDDKPELSTIVTLRNDIIRIIVTVDQQLGLDIAIVGWTCVWVCLTIIEPLLSTPLPRPSISAITECLTQLQEIVGIIARYAVMENLYQQSGGALSLKPEYKTELLSLCTHIFEYFSVSFTLLKKLPGTNVDLLADSEQCTELTEQIRLRDKACQGFKVVVDMKEESDSDSEEAEIEDVSDEGWEHISAEEAVQVE